MAKTFSYSGVAKFLHWTIALAILGMIALGWYMDRIPNDDPSRFQLFQLHKSIGITILLASLFRFGWRVAHPAPPYPNTMKDWEKFLARAVVVLFYVLMIGIPFVGWALVSSSPRNIPTYLYGIVPWPHLPVLPTLDNKREISHQLGTLHIYMAYSVLALLVLHVGGALKHHFIVKDEVVTGMAPNSFKKILNQLRGMKNA